ncbi:MAG TPA: hypothetical protein VFU31_15205 [Candidatus Binatia bacterium]|nr:hypothetical protein [Candidatus Binatia bacterium]
MAKRPHILIRHQFQRGRRIPGGLTPERFARITNILRNILIDMDRAINTELKKSPRRYNFDFRPKELHIRLNESGKPFPLPIFTGWVESADVRRTREAWNHPDPGLHRFGDDVYSEIYGEALNYAQHKDRKEHFRYRDWAASELLEKRAGEKATDPKAGNLFQTCLAIVAQGRAVGTLVVGFKREPPEPLLGIARKILGEWARGTGRNRRKALLNFLNDFDLGGPLLKDSNWWKRI